MKIAVQKNHLWGRILYNSLGPTKNDLYTNLLKSGNRQILLGESSLGRFFQYFSKIKDYPISAFLSFKNKPNNFLAFFYLT